MTIYDISLTVTPGMVTWENAEPSLSLEWASRIGAGSPANVSHVSGGMHTGTHLDAPLHFVADGRSVEALDLGALIGPAQVVEVFGRDQVTAADLERAGVDEGTERVLLKTDNTRRDLLHDPQFHPDYVGVAPSAAQWLVAHGVRLIGVDYLSVGAYDANVETHRILLGAGMVILEGLVLSGVPAGTYTLAALPPKVQGAEGSPCRAVLWDGPTAPNPGGEGGEA
ncbi:MAG: cyclase family protein [Armatimonadetes bacterium]|nr:cyclase family protein [Armatimonadota bacterium]